MADRDLGAKPRHYPSATRLALAVATALGVLLASFAGVTASSAADDETGETDANFIQALSSPRAGGPDDGAEVARAQQVGLDLSLLAGDGDGDTSDAGATRLTMAPFGQPITVQRTGIDALADGAYVWSGRATGAHNGTVIMVVRDGQVTGEIRTTAGLFEIRPAGSGQQLVEIDAAGYPTPAADFSDGIEYPAPQDLPPAPEVGADTGDQLDLLVVYTEATKNAAGGQAAILSQIDLAVAQTNQAMSTAGVPSQLRLVHAAEVPYVEQGNMINDLYDLDDPNDGILDEAAVLRNTYGADMVHLLVNSGQYCGIGFILGPSAVTLRACATGNLTFAHEQGHNMGVRHDWYVDDSGTYNHGYVSNAGSFRTIMAYSSGCTGSCPRAITFSSPNVFVNGNVAGVAAGTDLSCAEGVVNPGCDADNGQAITDNLNIIANWRQAVSGSTCQGQAVTVDIGAGDTPTAGNDVILGTPGDDTINALGGNDVVCGGDGDDVIAGNAGNDSIVGEGGNDTIYAGSGNDVADGGDGADFVGGGGGEDTVTGGNGADTINGGSDADTDVSGGPGNDKVSGGGGNDRNINGNGGNDIMGGNGGNDLIRGNSGNDIIYSGLGNDDAYGGAGNDTVNGAKGDDTLYGDASDDIVNGGAGSDDLFGNAGDDTLSGGGGNGDSCSTGTEATAGGDQTDASCEIVRP